MAVATILAALALTGLHAHDPISTKVTWDREIRPIVEARCVSCHSPGGRAPMSLASYEEARPWARAIREEVLTRRMPKWQVVRGYGDFSNDPSLSAFEIALIASWVDGGAPRALKAPGLKAGAASDGAGVDPSFGSGAHPSDTRESTVPCSARSLPSGRLVALRPSLPDGGSLRAIVAHPDGTHEPLLWLRGYDPDFPSTYWLRNPIEVRRGTRVEIEGDGPCSLTVLLAAKTAR